MGDNSSNQQIRLGMQVPLFDPNKKRPMVWSCADMNVHAKLLNAFANFKIERGSNDQVILTETNFILQLRNSSGSGGGGTVVRYRIKGDANDGAGLPLAGNPIMTGDTLTCRTWDGSNLGGSDISVAKSPLLRNSVTARTADGISMSYSYSSTVQRTSHVTSPAGTYDDEVQIVIPHYCAGDDIYAFDLTDVKSTGVANCRYLDTNIDRRGWCSIPTNPPP